MKRFSYTCIVGGLVLNRLEPYVLPDGASLAPYAAMATIEIARRSRHLRT